MVQTAIISGNNNHERGFTLIELSIVLVIIGLIVGGILTGQDLIRASQLRSIVSQKTKYSSAVNTFRNKYNCLPGDCSNAVQFFGAIGGNTSDNYTTSCYDFITGTPTSQGTCNGDGNGQIDGGTAYWNYLNQEGFLFWQQLAEAGLIEGNYAPKPTAGSPADLAYVAVGLNVPFSKAQANAGFSLAYFCIGSNVGLQYFTNGRCAHTFFYGGQSPSGGAYNNYDGYALYPVLTPLDAYNIDTKIDDGLPATGAVNSTLPTDDYGNHCATTNVVTTAKYAVTSGAPACALLFTGDGF